MYTQLTRYQQRNVSINTHKIYIFTISLFGCLGWKFEIHSTNIRRALANLPKHTLIIQCNLNHTFFLFFLAQCCLSPFPHPLIQFSSVQFISVQFSSVRFGSVRFGSVRFNSVQFSSVRFGSVQFNVCLSNDIFKHKIHSP